MEIVFVGMSGGVDSSVAAFLLKESGYKVKGITLVLSDVEGERKCCSLDEVKYAQYVCKYLGIEHEVLNVKEIFRQKIINPFVREYLEGKTPNACVNCNAYFKFGYMLEYAIFKGADYISTGHYAKIDNVNNHKVLKKAKDINKDQSYFLARLSKFQISKTIFPLSDLLKTEVREIAIREKLPLKPNLKESQDLCFVPGNNIKNFLLASGLNVNEGVIVDEKGNILGKHEGISFYTIGQRSGLNVAAGRRVYVREKILDTNTIVLSENPYFDGFTGVKLNWIAPFEIKDGEYTVKIRYRNSGTKAYLRFDGDRVTGTFIDNKEFAVTPGQLAVFYSNDIVVGSVFIEKAF